VPCRSMTLRPARDQGRHSRTGFTQTAHLCPPRNCPLLRSGVAGGRVGRRPIPEGRASALPAATPDRDPRRRGAGQPPCVRLPATGVPPPHTVRVSLASATCHPRVTPVADACPRRVALASAGPPDRPLTCGLTLR
jgi:hypothetical protein